MQYAGLALSLAWPQIVVAMLWFGAALVALWYARATRRPVFLFGGIAALMISLSEVLSPLRLAYRYFTHREYCFSTATCTVELQFGAAKFEWVIVGMAAFVLATGFYLEVRRARRRAAANNAARAAARNAAMAAASAGGAVPAGAFAGQYQAAAEEPAGAGSGDMLPDSSAAAWPVEQSRAAWPADRPPASQDEQPTSYSRFLRRSDSGPS